MSNRSPQPSRIGGPVRYDLLAQRHRPHYAAEVTAAVRELTKQGLRPYDISVALGIGIDAVTALLESAPGAARGNEAAELHRTAWQRGDR